LHEGKSVFKDKEIQERARKYREAMDARQREEQRNRIRWRRWEQIEQAARERAEAESVLAASAMHENENDSVHFARAAGAPARPGTPLGLEARTPSSALAQRLEKARRREREAFRATLRSEHVN
jgi:hypothetical protein